MCYAILFCILLPNSVPRIPMRVVKKRLNGRFLGITVKRGIPYRCLDGHVKEPYEMSMALGARP